MHFGATQDRSVIRAGAVVQWFALLSASRFPVLVRLLVALTMLVSLPARSDPQPKKEEPLLSLNTGSFVYHAYDPGGDSTQYFQNQLVSLGIRVDTMGIDSLVVGTFKNSFGDQCAILGGQKTWRQINSRLSVEGLYAYAGELHFQAFENCGESGLYKAFKNLTGVGFTPYIYHGFEYDLTKHISLETGVILPGIIVGSLQWHF